MQKGSETDIGINIFEEPEEREGNNSTEEVEELAVSKCEAEEGYGRTDLPSTPDKGEKEIARSGREQTTMKKKKRKEVFEPDGNDKGHLKDMYAMMEEMMRKLDKEVIT